MNLHEGTLIKRALIKHQETVSGSSYRVILRIGEWLSSIKAEYLNRIALYVQIWPNVLSDATYADVVYLQLLSDGAKWAKMFPAIGGGTGAISNLFEKEFCIYLPGGKGPTSPANLTLLLRTNGWVITEVHSHLIEVNAYLLDVPTDVYYREN